MANDQKDSKKPQQKAGSGATGGKAADSKQKDGGKSSGSQSGKGSSSKK